MKTRNSRNGFRPRASQKPQELELEIKRATAENIARAQDVVTQKSQELAIAQRHLNATMESLFTERGILEAEPIKITNTNPCKLIVRVHKFAKAEKVEKEKV